MDILDRLTVELFGRTCGHDLTVRSINVIKNHDLADLILDIEDEDELLQKLCRYKGVGRVTITDIIAFRREFTRETR